MATNRISNKNTSITTNDLPSLICKLCDKTYQHKDGPLLLPCLHSFCKPCLISYIKKKASNISCPTCDAEFTPPKDVSEFPINLRLAHLAQSSIYEKQATDGNVGCQVCDEESKMATHFCSNCCKFHCTKCKKIHDRYFGNDDHEFIELAKFEKGEFKIYSPPAKCPKHKEKLALFCEDCETLICLLCAQTRDHQNHGKISIDDTTDKEKAVLQEKAKSVASALDTMDGALKQVEEMQRRVEVSSKEANATIDKACDELIQAVEERRKTLKKKCEEVTEGKNSVLSNQMIEIQQLRKDLTFAQAHVKDAIDNQTTEEILSMKKSIHHRLNQAMEQYQLQSLDTREDDVINVSMDIEPIIQNIQQTGFLQDVPDPSKCSVQIIQENAGKEERGVAVTLRDEKGDPIKDNGGCVQYQLKKIQPVTDTADHQHLLVVEKPPKVNITRSNKNDGIVTLKFTPKQPGDEYEMTVMVRNKPIAGSPVRINGKIRDYENFPNEQPTIKNVGAGSEHCYGVAVHRDGTVYATNYSANTIKVFRADGTESQFGSSNNVGGQLNGPFGIGILNDTIHVSNYGGHSVSMFSIDGTVIGTFGTYGNGNGQFNCPIGIHIDTVGGRILTTEYNNNRIQFFTPQGTFIKFIQLTSRAYDVAIDNQGNIHAALYDNREIAVYSEADDQLIETYNLAGYMKHPSGIYIDPAGNRLISARDDNEFYIANPTGQLITTFNTRGGCGICMDNNNSRVYIAEYMDGGRVAIY